MKHLSIIVSLACVIFLLIISVPSGGEEASKTTIKPIATPEASTQADQVYPIAPGIWYPGDGPLPEKPMRYYRVRCWPGCHRGSAYGKYPNKPLNMTPIFPTRAALTHPAIQKDTK